MQAKLAGRQLIMVFLDSAGKYSRIGDAERVRRWITESMPRRCRSLGSAPSRRSEPPHALPAPARSAVVPERSRDLRRGGAQPLEPALLEAVGRRRDRQAGHQLALVVEDPAAMQRTPSSSSSSSRAVPYWLTFDSSRSSVGRSVMLLRVWPARPVRAA